MDTAGHGRTRPDTGGHGWTRWTGWTRIFRSTQKKNFFGHDCLLEFVLPSKVKCKQPLLAFRNLIESFRHPVLKIFNDGHTWTLSRPATPATGLNTRNLEKKKKKKKVGNAPVEIFWKSFQGSSVCLQKLIDCPGLFLQKEKK